MSKSASAPIAPLTRKQLSRAQRERRQRNIIITGAVIVFGLVLALILAGVIDQNFIRPRQAVARVNDTQITRAEFVKAARFQRYQLIRRYAQVFETAQLFGGDEQTQQFFIQQLQEIQTQLNDASTLGLGTLDSLVDDALIRQEAARRGITVSLEEVDETFREFFGFYPDGTPTPTATFTPQPTIQPTATLAPSSTPDATQAAEMTAAPTLTPTATLEPTATLTPTATLEPTATSTAGPSPTASATSTPFPTPTAYTTQGFATAVNQFQSDVRQQTGLTETDIRRLLESQLYREKLTEALSQEVPTTAEQARARHILVADEETARVVLERLAAGEDFGALAAEFSTDPGSKDLGGELDWFSRGELVPEFEAAAFSLPIGAVSEPVASDYGFHIIEVLAREERALDATALAELRQAALDDWLAVQRLATRPDGTAVVEIHDNWHNDVPTRPALPTG